MSTRIYISSSWSYPVANHIANSIRELPGVEVVGRSVGLRNGVEEDWSTMESRQIQDSDGLIVVADEVTSNIIFELGVAWGAGLPLLVVGKSFGSFPIALDGVRLVHLSKDMSEILRSVSKWVQDLPIPQKVKKSDSLKQFVEGVEQNPHFLNSYDGRSFERLIVNSFAERGVLAEDLTAVRNAGFDCLLRSGNTELWATEIRLMRSSSKASISMVERLIGAAIVRDIERFVFVTPTEFTESTKNFVKAANFSLSLVGLEELRLFALGNTDVLFQI